MPSRQRVPHEAFARELGEALVVVVRIKKQCKKVGTTPMLEGRLKEACEALADCHNEMLNLYDD